MLFDSMGHAGEGTEAQRLAERAGLADGARPQVLWTYETHAGERVKAPKTAKHTSGDTAGGDREKRKEEKQRPPFVRSSKRRGHTSSS